MVAVLITCPHCKSRHVISDHLKIFSDKPVTVEDLVREHGEVVKKGALGVNGDLEFWDDGTSTFRKDDSETATARRPIWKAKEES